MHSISNKELLVEDGLLLKYVGAKNKIWEDEGLFYRVWIPDSLKQQVIQTFHSIDQTRAKSILEWFVKGCR